MKFKSTMFLMLAFAGSIGLPAYGMMLQRGKSQEEILKDIQFIKPQVTYLKGLRDKAAQGAGRFTQIDKDNLKRLQTELSDFEEKYVQSGGSLEDIPEVAEVQGEEEITITTLDPVTQEEKVVERIPVTTIREDAPTQEYPQYTGMLGSDRYQVAGYMQEKQQARPLLAAEPLEGDLQYMSKTKLIQEITKLRSILDDPEVAYFIRQKTVLSQLQVDVRNLYEQLSIFKRVKKAMAQQAGQQTVKQKGAIQVIVGEKLEYLSSQLGTLSAEIESFEKRIADNKAFRPINRWFEEQIWPLKMLVSYIKRNATLYEPGWGSYVWGDPSVMTNQEKVSYEEVFQGKAETEKKEVPQYWTTQERRQAIEEQRRLAVQEQEKQKEQDDDQDEDD